VRSGTQIYARGTDLVVTASVSPGAELVADEAPVRAALGTAGVTVESIAASNGRLEARWSSDDPAETNTRALRALLDAGARVVSLNLETRSLEDAYLAIIKESRQ
jgi:hypothetical protein